MALLPVRGADTINLVGQVGREVVRGLQKASQLSWARRLVMILPHRTGRTSKNGIRAKMKGSQRPARYTKLSLHVWAEHRCSDRHRDARVAADRQFGDGRHGYLNYLSY